MSYLGWLLKERMESFAKQLCMCSCFAETEPLLVARKSTTMALRWFFSHDCEPTPPSLGASVSIICQQERRIGTHEENQTSGLLESSFWGYCTDIYSWWCSLLSSWRCLNSPSGWGKCNQLCRRNGSLTWKDLHILHFFWKMLYWNRKIVMWFGQCIYKCCNAND